MVVKNGKIRMVFKVVKKWQLRILFRVVQGATSRGFCYFRSILC